MATVVSLLIVWNDDEESNMCMKASCAGVQAQTPGLVWGVDDINGDGCRAVCSSATCPDVHQMWCSLNLPPPSLGREGQVSLRVRGCNDVIAMQREGGGGSYELSG